MAPSFLISKNSPGVIFNLNFVLSTYPIMKGGNLK